jgi:hypothetical protein
MEKVMSMLGVMLKAVELEVGLPSIMMMDSSFMMGIRGLESSLPQGLSMVVLMPTLIRMEKQQPPATLLTSLP